MSISGIGGTQGPQNNPNINNQNNIEQQVEQYKNSIFGQCDTDNSGKLEGKNEKGENEVKTFHDKVKAFIAKFTGTNNVQQPQETQPTGTAEDVKGATNEQTAIDNSYKFDEAGNVQSDITKNNDGSKDIKFGDETIHVSQNGDSISVKDESGRNVSLVKTPDGGYKFTDEKGEKHKFDKDMNHQT